MAFRIWRSCCCWDHCRGRWQRAIGIFNCALSSTSRQAAVEGADADAHSAAESHTATAGVPCELLQHWDPAQPLLIGGLSAAEEGRGFLQLRLKRHRWFGKLLKNRDPLTFSVGWRRYQSMPVYATEDANGRHR